MYKRQVEEDQYCIDISNQLMAAQAILRRANREVIQAHMASCVREAMAQGDEAAMEQKIQELAGIMAVSYTHLDVYKRQAFTHALEDLLAGRVDLEAVEQCYAAWDEPTP